MGMKETQKLVAGDAVWICGGKYVGRKGTVVKLTQMMVVVRLTDRDEQVRIWQSNVEKLEAQNFDFGRRVETVVLVQDDAAVRRLQEELKGVKEHLEELTGLLRQLTVKIE
jgi:ribosomal protein L24